MTSDPQHRLRTLLSVAGNQQDIVLTDAELTGLAANYPRCRGNERWEVREYARPTGPGAREFRVVRGSRPEDVYRSVDRGRAVAVGTALNRLESQDVARGVLRAAHGPFDFPPPAD